MENRTIYVKIYNEGNHNNSLYQEEIRKQFKTKAPNYLAAWNNLKARIKKSYKALISRNTIDKTKISLKIPIGNGKNKTNLNFKLNGLEKISQNQN